MRQVLDTFPLFTGALVLGLDGAKQPIVATIADHGWTEEPAPLPAAAASQQVLGGAVWTQGQDHFVALTVWQPPYNDSTMSTHVYERTADGWSESAGFPGLVDDAATNGSEVVLVGRFNGPTIWSTAGSGGWTLKWHQDELLVAALAGVATDGAGFVAVGSRGELDGLVVQSEDGEQWRASPVGIACWMPGSVTYGPAGYVMVGEPADVPSLRVVDGEIQGEGRMTEVSGNCGGGRVVSFCGSYFAAVGSRRIRSTDGLTWTAVRLDVATPLGWDVAEDGELVAIGSDGAHVVVTYFGCPLP